MFLCSWCFFTVDIQDFPSLNWAPSLSFCPPVLNDTCKCFPGHLKNLFSTSCPCSQSIRLAGIPVFCVSICCCLLSCSGPEQTLRVVKADNGVICSSLSRVSEQERRQQGLLSDLRLLPKKQRITNHPPATPLEWKTQKLTCVSSYPWFPRPVPIYWQLSNKGSMSWE